MDDMETSVLRSFVAVAEGATITEVAGESFVTQPTVTRGLQRLETEVGVPLFDRVGRGLRLNRNGEVLLTAARRALTGLDTAVAEIAAHRDPAAGTVRFGFLSPLSNWLIPELLGEYRRRFPQVSFALRQDGAARILTALAEGTLDVLLTIPDVRHPEVRWEPLFDEDIALVVPAGHRLAGGAAVPLTEVADETFMIFAAGYGLRSVTDGMCAAAGFRPRIGFEGHDLTTLYGLIRAGCGVGIFPALPQLPDGLRQLPLSPAVSRPIGVAWCPGNYRSAAAEAFRSFAIDYLGAIDYAGRVALGRPA
ncbi:MAG TPA: LysR substrate-binding domain-containing protein [Trebonia sp.]|jgi:LysR family transcriptional activator of glutamate synthase operon|nr:LysR substrate-binding domain-containing protein [Trebonia sp.]